MRAGAEIRQIRDIEYHLLPGTNRKTTDIVIERDGVVAVRPPRGLTPKQVDDTVFSKRIWIYRGLAEWRALNSRKIAREWVNGETFPYLGRHYQLTVEPTQEVALTLKNGRFHLLQKNIIDGSAEKVFEEFYVEKGRQWISQRIDLLAPRVGVAVAELKIKNIGYKWAACLANHQLHFHWKCMMAPPKIIDYIVVHELCHVRHRDHSDAFWNEVDKVMPDYRDRKEWLRLNGAGLDL